MNLALVPLLALFAVSNLAQADTYKTFNLSSVGQSDQTMGTVVLDTTSGVFTGADLVVSNNEEYTGPLTMLISQGLHNSDYQVVIDGPGLEYSLDFPIADLSTYSGGPICSTSQNCGRYGPFSTLSDADQSEGTLSLGAITTSSVTPEPESLALFGTGLLGFVGVLKRRLA